MRGKAMNSTREEKLEDQVNVAFDKAEAQLNEEEGLKTFLRSIIIKPDKNEHADD